jgi:type I restriction enzyme, S subunit
LGETADGSRKARRIHADTFLSFPILVPHPKEQQKIADCLSSIDDLISAQTQKVEALKTHKKGLMQQLFPREGETVPCLRFPEFRDAGEWEEGKLGDKNISIFVKERVSVSNLTLETYVSTENLLSEYEGVTKASRLPPSGSFTKFKEGDILISNIRPYLKKVWQANFSGASSNDVIVIRAGEEIRDFFLNFLLRNDDFIDYIMKGAKGVKMPRGDIDLMKEYPIVYPSPEEQQHIADCLLNIDNLITAQTQKLETLKDHKKGLMQQLFPSSEADSE